MSMEESPNTLAFHLGSLQTNLRMVPSKNTRTLGPHRPTPMFNRNRVTLWDQPEPGETKYQAPYRSSTQVLMADLTCFEGRWFWGCLVLGIPRDKPVVSGSNQQRSPLPPDSGRSWGAVRSKFRVHAIMSTEAQPNMAKDTAMSIHLGSSNSNFGTGNQLELETSPRNQPEPTTISRTQRRNTTSATRSRVKLDRRDKLRETNSV